MSRSIMGMRDKIELLKKVNFGDLDAAGDPTLDQYFLDNNYWQDIIEDRTYFVIGRKGTGKSAVYRMMHEQGLNNGYVVINSDFGEFPFERLLKLDDPDFAKPFQYQTIWKNMILNIFARAIYDSPTLDGDESNIHCKKIKEYVHDCLGSSVSEMHKEVVTRTKKSGSGLKFDMPNANLGLNLSHEAEKALSMGNGQNNISAINVALEDLLINYFLTCSDSRHIIVQFDRLDDNYNQYQDLDQYYNAVLSLFKVVYNLNQKFEARRITSGKVILYLRSDIWREFSPRDAESSRWDDFRYVIDWSITSQLDYWVNSKLRDMINKRIDASLHDSTIDFDVIFDKNEINLISGYNNEPQDVFKYVIGRTMHRPRDLIKFCKCIQNKVRSYGYLNYRTIKDAERDFCKWLVNSELANEINPVLGHVAPVYELLRYLSTKDVPTGTHVFTMDEFSEAYQLIQGINIPNSLYPLVNTPSEKLAFYLYDIGILQNKDRKGNYRSSYRNEGELDRNLPMVVHRGVARGINS